jgi:DNA-binding winged helix-turn-helix (wHTH) protein/TolB-like protein/Flp pilus assembly protein TadD
VPQETKDFYDFGPFRADIVRRLLLRDGQPVPVTSKVFDTLEVLLRNRERVVEKQELIKEIWPDSFVEEGNLTQNVSSLRKALCELPGEHRYIATVPGKGYRFVGAVMVSEPEPPPVEEKAQVPRPPRRRVAIVLIATSLVLVLGLSIWEWRRQRSEPLEVPRSLAVLPFRQLTPQQGEEYLGLGVADAVITRLSNIRDLVVRPTQSVLRYVNSSDPLAAGRELAVEELLSGSIQQSGDRVRVTVQLIQVRDGRPLWAETFDETTAGLFDIEDSVSSNVAGKMAVRLAGGEKEQLARHYTENVEAWRLYLKGRYAEFRFTPEGKEQAIEYFNQAIALDPGYAVAWAGLADAYTTASDWVLAPRDALPKAEAAARKALSFDGRLAEAHGSLAHALMHEWKLAEAGAEFQRALTLTPNHTSIYFAYAEYLTAIHKYDESATEVKKALKLDPLSPSMLQMLNWPLYLKGDYRGGLEALKEALRVDPNFWMPYMDEGYDLLALGQYSEAIAQFEKARSLNPLSTINLSGLGAAYARAGRRTDAQAMLTHLQEMSGRQYVAPVDFAYIHAALGDRDHAIEYLRRGYDEQSEMMLFLPLYGKFDGFSSDPRFQELQRKVGGS